MLFLCKPVIVDEYVDREFGAGDLKITPAHDINDYNLGLKYSLDSIDIFNDNGTLNANGGKYAGMDRFACRKAIMKDLEEVPTGTWAYPGGKWADPVPF